MTPGGFKDLGAVVGQERLVGGDEVFAARQEVERRCPGPLDAAGQLDSNVNRRVLCNAFETRREEMLRELNGSRFAAISNDNPSQ